MSGRSARAARRSPARRSRPGTRPAARRVGIYDFPQYYDLVFGSEYRPELEFLTRCFRKYALRPVRQLLEPACGTGRLLYRLAREGFDVDGLDINQRSVRYCNERLERHGLQRSAQVGDMASFALAHKVDAAFNMINGYRHLTSGRAATGHLRCVADALRAGGVYVLGLHLTPTAGRPINEEKWSASRGRLTVETHLWTIERNLRRRREVVGFSYEVRTPSRCFRLTDEIVFRTYTASQFERMLRHLARLEIAAVFDFNYDIDSPIELRPSTQDAVFVLRKRRSR